MKYLINILKNKAIIIVLMAVATIIGFLYFWARSVPKEKVEIPALPTLPTIEIKQQPITVKPQFSQLRGKFANFPKELKVYQIDSPKISHDQAIKIATSFAFEETPQIFQDIKLGPDYNWSSPENYLSITINRGSVSYGLDLLNNPGILKGNLSSLEEIKTTAISFLDRQIIPLPQDLKPTIKQTQYLKKSGPTYKPAVSPEEADVVQIDFQFKINEMEIFQPIPNASPLRFRIGPEMKIVSLDYQPPFSNFAISNSYFLRTEKEVLKEIEATPKISYLQFPYGYLPTQEDYQKIRSIEFTNVKLGYYQPLLPENYLQPVFLIFGTVQLRTGQIGEAFLYLPAVSEKYFTLEP